MKLPRFRIGTLMMVVAVAALVAWVVSPLARMDTDAMDLLRVAALIFVAAPLLALAILAILSAPVLVVWLVASLLREPPGGGPRP
jgi:hypothetical protein